MQKFIISLLVLASAQAQAMACLKPTKDTAVAFAIITKKNTGDLRTFLSTHKIPVDALNEKCEDMYLASIRARNEVARKILDKTEIGPKTPEMINYSINGTVSSYYEHSLKYGVWEATQDLKKRGGMVTSDYVKNDFYLVAEYNTKDVVLAWIKAGTNVNEAGHHDVSPLMAAVLNNSLSVVTTLLQAGAKVNATDDEGLSSLMIAAIQNKKSIVETLLKAGASVKGTDLSGRTVLMMAAEASKKEIILMLLKVGADLRASDEVGHTALMYAVGADDNEAINSKEVVEVLLAAGASKKAKNESGMTAYDIARENGVNYASILKP